MIAVATTTIDVYRDADAALPDASRDTDGWGDEVETPRADANADGKPDPIIPGIPAALLEKSRRVFDPTSGDQRLVVYSMAQVTGNTDVRRGDVVVDQRTGYSYSVTEVVQPISGALVRDLQIDLERTGGEV